MNPRIRGRVAEIAEPPELVGKWCYEVSLWDFAGEKQFFEPAIYGPFETQELAQEKGREIVRKISNSIEKDMTGKISGRYLDLKNGAVMRPWEEN